jgi:polyisoprenyl-teichoic acid--peptidoglycan teichoic acid transferase
VRRKLVALTLALSAWVAGTVAGSLATAPSAGASPLLVVGHAHADYLPALSGDKPIFVLVLGSDARPGTPMDHGLSDSIHILGINPSAHRATLYGIPRDSWVSLATGGTGKINSAMPAGGPEKEIETIENVTGIHFDYYALTGFNELVSAVDELGGLKIDIPYTVVGYDQTFSAGEQTLDGRAALGYARTRHSLPLGDFDRSLNQGRLMLAALENFRSDFSGDPTSMFAWLSAGLRNVQTSLSIDELNQLAFLATQIKPKNVTNLVAHATFGTQGGQSVVYLTDENKALWQDMAADGYILQKDIPHAFQPSPT